MKLERKSKSSGKSSKTSGIKSSKSNSTLSSRLSKLSVREKVIKEKVCEAELTTKASFMKKNRDAE